MFYSLVGAFPVFRLLLFFRWFFVVVGFCVVSRAHRCFCVFVVCLSFFEGEGWFGVDLVGSSRVSFLLLCFDVSISCLLEEKYLSGLAAERVNAFDLERTKSPHCFVLNQPNVPLGTLQSHIKPLYSHPTVVYLKEIFLFLCLTFTSLEPPFRSRRRLVWKDSKEETNKLRAKDLQEHPKNLIESLQKKTTNRGVGPPSFPKKGPWFLQTSGDLLIPLAFLKGL